MTPTTPQAPAPRPQEGAAAQGERIDVAAMNLPRVGAGTILALTVLFLALLAALFVVGFLPRQARQARALTDAKAAQNARPVVRVAQPQREPDVTRLSLPGTTSPLLETALFPRASGYLVRQLVDIGDHVQAGQLLAVISSPEVDAQLAQARAGLSQAQAQALKSGNDLDLANKTLQRYEGLARTGGVTKQALDQYRTARDQAASALQAAQAAVAAAQADVQRLSDLQGFEKVVAPFRGTITARNYDLGALLSASSTTPLFHLVDARTLRVFVDVPQPYVLQIHPQDKAYLTVSNYPGRRFEGRVMRTSDSLDPQTRTLRVEVDFANTHHALFPGMYGQVEFELRQTQPPLTIPSSALIFGPAGLQVAVLHDGVAAYRTVKVGQDFGTRMEILDGLMPQEQVIVNPGERLADGMPVQVAATHATAQSQLTAADK